MSLKRVVIIVLLIVLLLPAIGLSVFILSFNPNRYAPQLIVAVEKATGRQLIIGGQIQLALSLAPTIEVSDLSLANPPGYPDPNGLTLGRLEARVALLPLLSHKVDILKLVLVSPDIVLERDASGHGNWDLTPSAAAATQPVVPAVSTPVSQSGYKIAIESVEIQNGLLTFKTAQAGKTAKAGEAVTLALTGLTGTADSLSSPLNLNVSASYNGTPFTLTGEVGPVERFSGVGSAPWPVNLTLSINGASATVQGSLTDPKDAKGYNLTLNANIPALETLTSELPPGFMNGAPLPPIHGITMAARIIDQNSTLPAIENFSLKTGDSDLSPLRPGLTLTALDAEMPSLASPATIQATGSINGAALSLQGDFGPLQPLINPAWLPPSAGAMQGSWPVSVQAQAGDAKLSVTGGIATPAKFSGVALAVSATVPDLSKLSDLSGSPLPTWKNIVLQATLIDPGGLGLATAAGLDGLVLTMDNASLGGDASFYAGAHPRLQAAITAQQINLDALLAAIPAASSPGQPTAPKSTAQSTKIIPDTQLPLNYLTKASADVQISADSVIYNHATYTAIQGHAVLASGVLTINPLTAQLPGGSVSANAGLDATKEPAVASASFSAPALALGPFLKALNLPDTAQGTVQAAMTMSGTGDSLQAIASTVNGQLGLASVNGTVDGSVLDGIFGAALRAVALPESLVGAQGPVAVRCFGLRIDASNGIGSVRALTLDSSRLLLQGGGMMNFGDETLDVVIRPQLRIAGNQLGVPVKIGGTFAHPTTSVAPFGALQEAAKTAVGLPVSVVQEVAGSNSFLGNALNSLGISPAGDSCPAALALARLGKPGPAPMAPAASTGAVQELLSVPKSLLSPLFGK
jgi:AsmA protein